MESCDTPMHYSTARRLRIPPTPRQHRAMGEKKRRQAAAAAGIVSTGRHDAQALALAKRAQALTAQSAFEPALHDLTAALELAPHLDALWAQFGELIRFFGFMHPLHPRLRAVLERALEHPAVDPGNLARPITTAALSRAPGEVFAEPLLLRLLQDAVARDARLEDAMAAERRRALLGAAVPLDRLIAIAHQCFNTEYVLDETDAESDAIRVLATRLGAPADYALYASYRALHSLPDAQRLAQELAQTPLASLARRQILEPLEEERLHAGIATIGDTAGPVSAAVRAQYEANPYPRWIRMQTRFDAAPLARIVRELFPDLGAVKSGPTRILIAGCGTGQNAIGTACRFADANVLAVDLSLASLAFAKRKTLELGVANISYRQADILALGSLGERFGLVEASGVLHHLADPLAGWRALAGLVEPGGFMRIGLYSERGRRHFAHAREFLGARGLETTPAGIRAARRAIRAAAEDPLLARVARNEDFFSLSGCRDMLFHVQEQCFTLPQVRAMIESLGVQFLGFEFADSGITAVRYLARFASDPLMRDLDNWDRYEQDNPDAFARMYQFWVRKPA